MTEQGEYLSDHQRPDADDEGFTLVELLVVLSIIVLLVMLVAPQVIGYLGRARVDTTRVQMDNIASALDLYYLDMGRYPTSTEGLRALSQDPNAGSGNRGLSWQGPYMRATDDLTDAWGNTYIYVSPGQQGDYDLLSYGADGLEGGEDEDADITNW